MISTCLLYQPPLLHSFSFAPPYFCTQPCCVTRRQRQNLKEENLPFLQSYHIVISATMDFNMPKAKSLETGESLVVVRGCGSNVSCLCSTCGGVPSAAPCSLSVVCRCHSLLYSDTCSAAECMLLICTDVDVGGF